MRCKHRPPRDSVAIGGRPDVSVRLVRRAGWDRTLGDSLLYGCWLLHASVARDGGARAESALTREVCLRRCQLRPGEPASAMPCL